VNRSVATSSRLVILSLRCILIAILCVPIRACIQNKWWSIFVWCSADADPSVAWKYCTLKNWSL
jgi:hypothetical protein